MAKAVRVKKVRKVIKKRRKQNTTYRGKKKMGYAQDSVLSVRIPSKLHKQIVKTATIYKFTVGDIVAAALEGAVASTKWIEELDEARSAKE